VGRHHSSNGMRHVLQSLNTGATEVAEIPCPVVGRGQVLIRSTRTLVSAGTERMLVEFGKAGWIDKARQQPDKVRMVLDKIRTDGLMPTVAAVLTVRSLEPTVSTPITWEMLLLTSEATSARAIIRCRRSSGLVCPR
jgi:hypothetical protein